MKTLYKSSRVIAAAIVGTLVLSAGAAVAITKDSTSCEAALVTQTTTQAQEMGRFEVTPNTVKFVAPAEVMGRFVISQHRAVFVPAA
ncbi:MAG: hypothetical protein IPJ25_12610 [Rhodocyclaceae bacterium]|nr:hypothetical protein [Rhodocyclaceae bacterium]MBK9625632.1 hypothetical protein [Rhodocyclaceae bacterium]MBP6110651.1 hypothetical protein [Rhodocyclaceae bacterium]